MKRKLLVHLHASLYAYCLEKYSVFCLIGRYCRFTLKRMIKNKPKSSIIKCSSLRPNPISHLRNSPSDESATNIRSLVVPSNSSREGGKRKRPRLSTKKLIILADKKNLSTRRIGHELDENSSVISRSRAESVEKGNDNASPS